MKKLILAFMLVFAGLEAFAQYWVGGSIGFGVQSISASYDGEKIGDTQNVTSIAIQPEFGYQINDKFAVAVEFAVDYAKSGDDKTTVWGVGPYARYNFAQMGVTTIFGELAGHYLSSKSGDDDAIGGFNIQLRPGLEVALSESCSLVGKINLFEYMRLSKDKAAITSVGFEASTNLSVGFVCKF